MERVARARRAADDRQCEDFSVALRPHLGRLTRLVALQAPRALTEDVMQETLLRAFRSWPRFDPGRPLWPWLARIAQRACATAWQADARWRGTGQGDASVAPLWESPGSDQHVAALHARTVVAATLADLTDRERTLLYRSDGEEAPRRVLAGTFTLSPGAVRVALHRARHRFRRSATGRWEDIGVASAFLVNRLRLRLRTRAAEPLLPTLALSASVFVTLVVTAISPPAVRPQEIATGSGSLPAAGALVATSPTAASGREAQPGATSSVTVPPPTRGRPDRSARAQQALPSSGPLPAPDARADIGPDGLYGGVRLDFTTPDGRGHVSASPSVRCQHSTAMQTVCLVTGSLPSAGPVEFYGSGDGDP